MTKRNFGTSFYIWTAMPRLGPKATEIKQALSIPKGTPKRVEAFDKLNIKNIYVGMRHSAAITCINSYLVLIFIYRGGITLHIRKWKLGYSRSRKRKGCQI